MSDVRELVREAVGSYEPRGDLGIVERRVERRHRRQRLSAGVVAFAVFAAGGWVAWTAFGPREVTPGSTPTPPAVVEPVPVPLGELPDMGVALATGDRVELVDLDGTVLATLRGYELAGSAGAEGVWLRRDGQLFALDVAGEALVPVPDDRAIGSLDDEGPAPSLAPPPGPDGAAATGSWRFALPSGSGITLAQWTDECDDPQAFWIDQSGAARVLTGQDRLSGAPASLALGWAGTGEAIALVRTGSCGAREDAPGIYLFSAPGSGRLVRGVSAIDATADAWGTGL
jgi:hypothetical protein